jgi:YidC/Oxa1 family membrane protein insertase
MNFIWETLVFRPLLNLLVGLYNTIGMENLGLAIIWLTVLIRVALLPLSIKDEKRRDKERKLKTELKTLQRQFANNPSVLREEQRRLMRTHRFRRWPRIVILVVQALVFLILYQIFIHGINLSQVVDALYQFVRVPISINTSFLGINVGERSFILSGLCGLLLFANIWLDHQLDNRKWTPADMLFLFGFPAVTFFVLFLLPGVKSLFILTTMVFSDAMLLISVFRESIKEQDHIMAKRAAEKALKQDEGIPHPTERFR